MAAQWLDAPRKRLSAQRLVLGLGTSTNLTTSVPTQADLGDAPFCDLLVSCNTRVAGFGFLGLVLTDDVAFQVGPTHGCNWLIEPDVDGWRLHGVFPYSATLGALDTPLGPNYLYLRNGYSGNLTVELVFEIPTLDYE